MDRWTWHHQIKIFSGYKPCQLWIKSQRFRGSPLMMYININLHIIPVMMEVEMVSKKLSFYVA
jgi:hypothetical protein